MADVQGDDGAIRISVIIYPEDAAIYEWAKALPSSKIRRRSCVIAALSGGVLGHASDLPARAANEPMIAAPAARSPAPPAGASKPPVAQVVAIDESMVPDDLAHLFGLGTNGG